VVRPLQRWSAWFFLLGTVPACEALLGIEEPTLRGMEVTDAGTDVDAAPPPGPVAALVAKTLADARCGALQKCLGHLYSSLTGLRLNNAGFRDEPCEVVATRALLAKDFAGLDESITAGRVEYDPDWLQDCASATVDLSCDLDLVERPNACKLALRGTRVQGASCRSNVECGDAEYCDMSSTCPGVCQPRRAAGQGCVDPVVLLPKTARECRVGLLCVEGKCLNVPGKGDACALDANAISCTTGLGCFGGASGFTCEPALPATTQGLGASCAAFAGTLCAEDLACEFSGTLATGSCRGPYAAGAPCCASFPELCPVGSRCKGSVCENSVAGTCTKLPGAGEPCLDLGCAPYARCIGGVCRALADVGQSCDTSGVCYSGRCSNGVCTPPCLEGGG
jgi:hypothetical protein